jgi:TusA-related sulfurtransferase
MTTSETGALAADVVLDAGEASCADLLIRMVRVIRPLPPGSIVEVVAYSTSARLDIPAWCRMTGNPLLHVRLDHPARFLIRRGEK